MASQIPTKEDLGQTPTSRSGEITVQPAQNFVPQAVERLGQSIGQAGADVAYVERLREMQQRQIDAHENLAKATDIIAKQGDENDAAVHNMAPGGVGLLDQQAKSWKTKIDAFRQTVPADKWPVLENYLTKQGAIQANQLRNQVYPEQDRFYGAKQDATTYQQLDQISRNPGDANAQTMARTALEASIRSNPYLTPIAKQKRLDALPGAIAEAHTGGVLADPEQSKHILDDPLPSAATGAPPPTTKFMAVDNPAGLVTPGNIDLTTRPRVPDGKGNVSTVLSTSYRPDTGPYAGKEVMVPRVTDEGKILAPRDAIQYWQKKGQNLGVFDTPENANAYGEQLHQSEAAKLRPAKPAGQDLQPPPGLSPAGQDAWKRANAGDRGHIPAGAPYVPSAAEKQAEITTGDVGTAPASAAPAAPTPASGKVAALVSAAKQVGVSPEDLATAIFYESGGDPNRWGGKGGDYFGLIQFGSKERRDFNVHPGMSFEQQMPAVVAFLKARGFRPGMGMMDLYSTINAGSPGHYQAYDGNGTVIQHVHEMDHNGSRQKAVEFLGGKYVPSESAAVPEMYRPSDFPDGGRARAADWVRRNNPDAPPEIVDRLAGQIITNLNREDHVTAQDRAALTQMIASDKASISTTGQEVPGLTQDRVAAALGREQADNWMEDRVQAHRFYAATNDMAQLAPTEMAQRLAQLEPQPGSPRYVQEAKTYKAASDIATHIKANRINDPASAVSDFPAVSSAMQGASYAQPATIKALVSARLAAQAAIGIPTSAQSPITVNEARQLGAPFLHALPGQQRPALEQLVNQLEATFGDQAPAAMRSILQTTKVDKDTNALIGALLQKVGKGQPVTQEHGEAVDRALTDQAATAAASPFLPSQSERVEASSGAKPAAAAPRPGQRNFGPFPGRSGGQSADQIRQRADAKAAAGKVGPVPTMEEITDLQRNPAKAKAFDQAFGPGTAAFHLSHQVPGARATSESVAQAGVVDPSILARQGPQSGTRPMSTVPPGAGQALGDALTNALPSWPQPSSNVDTSTLRPTGAAGALAPPPNRAPQPDVPAKAPIKQPAVKRPATRRRARNTSGIVPQPNIPNK